MSRKGGNKERKKGRGGNEWKERSRREEGIEVRKVERKEGEGAEKRKRKEGERKREQGSKETGRYNGRETEGCK